jgi:hypothetical protein
MTLRVNLRGRWNAYEVLFGYSRGEVDDYRRVLGAYRAAQTAAQQGHASAPIGAAVQGLFSDPALTQNAVRQPSLAPGGDRWAGGRFASRAEVRTARRDMRRARDQRRAAGESPHA